jgi:hypothetical protein
MTIQLRWSTGNYSSGASALSAKNPALQSSNGWHRRRGYAREPVPGQFPTLESLESTISELVQSGTQKLK